MEPSFELRNKIDTGVLPFSPHRRATHPGKSVRPTRIFGESLAMRSVYRLIERVAPTSGTVLITGESGSGKELVAHAIHDRSERAQGPFVAINCGAIPGTLIEAELFGFEKGSFTGATRQHLGCFERAKGGTLFLDEITEMPLEMQVRLLRVLEAGRFFRVGGTTEITADVRIVAATNREPRTAIDEGRLRQDLYFRLAVFPISLPPLRARTGDVRLLAQHFLHELNVAAGTGKSFAQGSLDVLDQHDWPGNVRELKNAIHRAFILGEDTIEVGPVAAVRRDEDRREEGYLRIRIGSSLAHVEQQVIMATLDHCGRSKKATAELLGISDRTLYSKLCDYQQGGQ